MAKVELDLTTKIKKLEDGLKRTEKGLKDVGTQSNKTSKQLQTNMNKTSKVVSNLTASLGALLSIGAAVRMTKAIIDVRKEFEKFRAVLTNTLGSSIAANREFEKIKKFASETPFSVRELTDSFVRLVNQGFKPTMEEMRKMGDLAAAVGKDYIQLTEAIIDAQTGEFERLKEFGIRAKKEGDKVTFTFKEQESQVAFTAKAIQEYVLSLGDMEGVSGAMAAISETLGGKISNLQDAWDGLLDALGGRTSKIMITVIDLLGELTNRIEGLLSIADPDIQAAMVMDDFRKILVKLDKEQQLEQLVLNIQKWRNSVGDVREEISKLEEQKTSKIRTFFSGGEAKQRQVLLDAQIQNYKDLIIQLGIQEDLATQLNKDIAEGNVVLSEQNDETEIQVETVDALQKKYKELLAEKKALNINDIESIEIKNAEIEAIKKQIIELDKLGKAIELKPLGVTDIVGIEEDPFGTVKIAEELAAEQLRIQEQLDADILRSQKERLTKEAALIEQEKLLRQGSVDVVMAGLDLLKAATKDNAKAQQAISIVQAIINGAVGITKTGAELGYPAAIPFQIALALQTLAQIAIIRAQKFEKGGYEVLGGKRHAQGGVDIGIGEAEAGEAVAVFNRQATKKHGKFLPAFVKMINDNKEITQNPDGTFNFFYDDSRQVSKLEDIKKLLSKPDIRYEKGYRIETRKGQVTKVKI